MSADDGYAYFVKRVSDIAIAQGHHPVQWSEVYDHFKTKLDKKTIVHIWKSVTNVTEVVANGYQVLVNVGYDALSWYLDNLNVKWDKVYLNDPCHNVPDDLCAKYVLGGHGEMWCVVQYGFTPAFIIARPSMVFLFARARISSFLPHPTH
jgi:hexosaminidase